MSTRTRLAPFAILLSFVLANGCALQMDAPDNYLRLADAAWPYEYQAVSSEDCRLTARRIDNPEKGGLPFWSKAITNQLVQAKGYALVSQQDLETQGGWKGREFLFSTHNKGAEFYYLLALFPVSDKIYLAEAGGERRLLEPDLPALRQAIRTLH